MKYLLDVNVLVAWGWSDHIDHDRVVKWIARIAATKADVLMTSPIPQLGFVRVSVQRANSQVSVAKASEVLAGMLEALGEAHQFLPDDQAALQWPEWCHGAGRTTDAHLLALARAHDAELATLDAGIPTAFLVPQPPTEATKSGSALVKPPSSSSSRGARRR